MPPAPEAPLSFSIVVCSDGRPASLATTLRGLRALPLRLHPA